MNGDNRKLGKLYGVGVGPGDPELITLKALRVLKEVSYVFTASSAKNEYSLSSRTVEAHVQDKNRLISLNFSMLKDRGIRKEYWKKNSETVLEKLREGLDVAFVTVGDPMTYSTFGYLMKTILEMEPEVKIEIVPGITSYQAAAAASRTVLSENNENLLIMSGVEGIDLLRESPGFLKNLDNIVVLKVYRKYSSIIKNLKALGLLDRSILVSNCTLASETICTDLTTIEEKKDNHPPYFSLMLIKKKGE